MNKCKQKAVRAICKGLAMFAAKVQEMRGDQSLSQLIRKPADSLFEQKQAEVSDVSVCVCVCARVRVCVRAGGRAHTGACKHTRRHICIMPYLPLFITHIYAHISTPDISVVLCGTTVVPSIYRWKSDRWYRYLSTDVYIDGTTVVPQGTKGPPSTTYDL
jgi:hypothetical protein